MNACESCGRVPATQTVTFKDGAFFEVCDGCAPSTEWLE